ncbi:MAG: hypothetical protein ACLR23_10050 [Clostridia bacterium]
MQQCFEGCGKSVDESSDDNSQTSSSESGNAESGSREKVTVTVSSISWEPDPADVYLTQYIEEELGIILIGSYIRMKNFPPSFPCC